MSKFEELCKSYKTSRENFLSNKDDSYSFAATLVENYIRYLQIPRECLKFLPLNKQIKPNTTYTLFGSIHFDEDGFWHLGVQITIRTVQEDIPEQEVLICFMFKKIGPDRFLVKLYSKDSGHLIDIGNYQDYTVFFDFLQQEITALFDETRHEFTETVSPLKTLGVNPQYE